jgi:hypothetical protein
MQLLAGPLPWSTATRATHVRGGGTCGRATRQRRRRQRSRCRPGPACPARTCASCTKQSERSTRMLARSIFWRRNRLPGSTRPCGAAARGGGGGGGGGGLCGRGLRARALLPGARTRSHATVGGRALPGAGASHCCRRLLHPAGSSDCGRRSAFGTTLADAAADPRRARGNSGGPAPAATARALACPRTQTAAARAPPPAR